MRDALVATLVAHPVLEPARSAVPPVHAEVLAPWWHLPSRIARVLPELLTLPVPGSTSPSWREPRWCTSPRCRPGRGGDLHRFAPQHAFADLGLDPSPYVPAVAGSPLGGDTECVAATAWTPGTDACVSGPIARVVWDLAGPRRQSLGGAPRVERPGGSSRPRQPVHRPEGRNLAPFTAPTFSLRGVDPGPDAPLLHGWFTEPRAAFWGMAARSVEDVAGIYGWIASQDHLTADLVLLDGRPVGLVQAYDPLVDEIGEHYDRRTGDLGPHLFLADDSARAGTTQDLMAFVLSQLFADPRVQRLVLEPDVANTKSLALLQRLGAELGPVTELPAPMPDLPAKTAQFAFLPRPVLTL